MHCVLLKQKSESDFEQVWTSLKKIEKDWTKLNKIGTFNVVHIIKKTFSPKYIKKLKRNAPKECQIESKIQWLKNCSVTQTWAPV